LYARRIAIVAVAKASIANTLRSGVRFDRLIAQDRPIWERRGKRLKVAADKREKARSSNGLRLNALDSSNQLYNLTKNPVVE
jgi:hypothetical protein